MSIKANRGHGRIMSACAGLLVIISCLITACKKEPVNKFEPVGYWTGSISFYHAALVNRADGSFRLYTEMPAGDTAAAVIKFDGKYVRSNEYYKGKYVVGADTGYLNSVETSRNYLRGYIEVSSAPTARLPFELARVQ